MKRLVSFVGVALALSALVLAEPTVGQGVKNPPLPIIVGPKVVLTDVQTDVGKLTLVVAQSSDPQVRYWSPDGLSVLPVDDLKDSKRMYVVANTTGQFRLVAWTASAGTPSEAAVCVVTAGNPPPVPPGPGPTPPVPPTPPTPPPIPTDGFRMLIVYDKEADRQIADTKIVRDYLWKHCIKGADGRTPEYRIWNKIANVAGSAEPEWFKKAFARYPGKGTWLIVASKDAWEEKPLPANVEELMMILQKVGGP